MEINLVDRNEHHFDLSSKYFKPLSMRPTNVYKTWCEFLGFSKIDDRCRRGFMLVTTLRCWWLVLYISKVTYVMILSPTNCHHQKRWNPRKGVNDRNLTKNKIKNRIMINIFFRINEKRARLNIKLIICRSRFIIG